jgi:hypothetical protein
VLETLICPGLVVDQHGLPEELLQALPHDADPHVGDPAGGSRDDDCDGSVRVILGLLGGAGPHGERQDRGDAVNVEIGEYHSERLFCDLGGNLRTITEGIFLDACGEVAAESRFPGGAHRRCP